MSTASDVFLNFTTQLYQYFSGGVFLFALFSGEPEVFLPKYSQTAILITAHFRRVVRDWSLITERGGGYKTGGGGAREVLPLRKGGAEKDLAMLKGGAQQIFWVVFMW